MLANVLYSNHKGVKKGHVKTTGQNYLAMVGLCLVVAGNDDSTIHGKTS